MKVLSSAWSWIIAIIIVVPMLILASLAIGFACIVAGVLRGNMGIIKGTARRVKNVWYV